MKRSSDNTDEPENTRPQKRDAASSDTPEERLLTAAREGNFDRVRDIMNQGVMLAQIYASRASIYILDAIIDSNIQTAQALITAGANKEYLINDMTLLHFAIKYQETEIALALITAGANPEAICEGRTALHFAILTEQTKIVKALITAGANKEVLYNNLTPLQYTIISGKTEIAQALITAGANKEVLYNNLTPLQYTIISGKTEIAQALITAGANKEVLYHNLTPLHFAIAYKKIEIAQALIDGGANLEATYKNMTPLHYAIWNKQTEIAQALLTAGANKEALYHNLTPLQYAIRSGNKEIAQALITAGANKAFEYYILKDVSDPTLLRMLLPHCLMDGIPLANLLANLDYFNSDERIEEFVKCINPFEFLKLKNLLLPVTQAALELLQIAREIEEYESTSLANTEDAMNDSKVARANWHFESKVKPHFKNAISAFMTVHNHKIALKMTLPKSGRPEQNTLYVGINEQNQLYYTRVTQNGDVIQDLLELFLEEGETLTEEKLAELEEPIIDEVTYMEPILAIEKQIRALILNEIQKQAEKDNKQTIIDFINDNKDKLIQADPTAMQASCNIFTQSHPAQAAWRGYNPYAPVIEWQNLLTKPVNNAVVYSTRFAHDGELRAHVASTIARERVAYYYLAVIDANEGDENTRIVRIENFINQLADIRNAHGLDDPSCYPGTLTRCAEMGAYHSVAQLPPTTKELISDFVKVKVLTAFQKEIAKLPTFQEKEALYNALVELTTLQAKEVILNPEDYQPEWLDLRQKFIALIGTKAEVVLHITENNLFPLVEKDHIYVEQALLDIAGGTTNALLADYFNRHTDSVPTSVDKQNANPFGDDQSEEYKSTQVLLDTVLQAVPQYATSMRKLHNLRGYLANKVPNLLNGTPLKDLLTGIEIADEKFDNVLNDVNAALENAGCKARAKIANPFEIKVKQMEMHIQKLSPERAAPYRRQLASLQQKQQHFNEYFPFVQEAFQGIEIEDERLARLTEAFASNLATSNQGFNQEEFIDALNDIDKPFAEEHRKRLADLAMRLFEKHERLVEAGRSRHMRIV